MHLVQFSLTNSLKGHWESYSKQVMQRDMLSYGYDERNFGLNGLFNG